MYKKIPSPVGELTLIADDKNLLAVLWQHEKKGRVNISLGGEDNAHPVLCEAERQMQEYFIGQRKVFHLPLSFVGTEFQQKVWHILLTIPYGETRTYLEIAKQIGNADAVRAVGHANGKNPISIITPCHRVVGASGKLTGFAGGIENKAYLLQLEQQGSRPTLF